jgi:DNA repair ATPase RecN
MGLKEDNLEDLTRHLDIHCSKRGLTRDTFMNLVANISSLSDSLGVPVEELPGYINSSKELLDDINLEIKNRISKLKRVTENYNVTMTDLEEYRRNRPLIETLKAKDMELKRARRQITGLEAEVHTRNYESSVIKHEMREVNGDLERPIDYTELCDIAKDLVHYPSKYPDLIGIIREAFTVYHDKPE